MRYILLVEDNKNISNLLKIHLEILGGKVSVVQAFNLEQARAAFGYYGQDLLCIILGGWLENNSTTLPLVKEILGKKFLAPIISLSGDRDLQEKQMKDGCTHQFEKMEFEKLKDFVKTLIDPSKK